MSPSPRAKGGGGCAWGHADPGISSLQRDPPPASAPTSPTFGSAFASARTTVWGYDALGQVTKADSSVSGFDRAYEYDAIGNRKKPPTA